MNLCDISNTRLASLQITDTKLKTAKDIVGWMGAMQAQNFSMAKWGVGVRLPGSTDEAIQTAFNRGEILRTHLLRPTWHFVSADDIHWMLELTAPHVKASMKSRDNELGLTKEIVSKSNSIIEKALSAGKHLTKDDIIAALGKASLPNDSSRAYHLILNAELDGIICSGTIKGKDQTYSLLDGRAPKKKSLSRNDALAELVKRYFASHGPATLHDFLWWSGLRAADARKGLAAVQSEIVSERIGSQTYWFSKSYSSPDIEKDSVHLLPAFDEFIISYKDRTPSIHADHHSKAVSSNGVFRPVIVLDGRVVGLWKRTTKRNKIIVEANFFKSPNKKTKDLIAKKVEIYGKYLDQKTEVVWGKIAFDQLSQSRCYLKSFGGGQHGQDTGRNLASDSGIESQVDRRK